MICKACGRDMLAPIQTYIKDSWFRRLLKLCHGMKNECIWCGFVWWTAPKNEERP